MDNTIVPRKSLGQHWLNDQASLEAICDSAELSSQDTVLEIGPGLGGMTKILVDKAKQVIAVELDEKLVQMLDKNITATNLEVISQDILKFDFSSLPSGYKIVANIPYYLTNNLIRTISESHNPPATAVLLVQKEVAERAAAKAGTMSVLSITAQFFWDVQLGRIVEAKLFIPPPKVDSQVLILKRRDDKLLNINSSKEFFRIVKAGFSQRRKTLLNSLSAGLQLSRDQVITICESASIDSSRRAQSLSIEEWYRLYQVIHT